MESGKSARDLYLGLTEHTSIQLLTFFLIALGGYLAFFYTAALPILQWFFQGFFHAEVSNQGREIMVMNYGKVQTHPIFEWLIQPKNVEDAYYILNPAISFAPFCALFGFSLAFYISAILPRRFGYIHQKIQREIVNSLDKVARTMYHESAESEHTEVEEKITKSDIRHLHEYAALHNVEYGDLETLRKALVWRRLSWMKQALRIHDGIVLYMRSYFTAQYSNNMLGFVYIGAAILIIVIGLRGLKFIPATKPSVIIFALQLEFVLLIIYAITVIYTKEGESQGMFGGGGAHGTTAALQNISSSLDSLSVRSSVDSPSQVSTVHSKEVENLLRIFINKARNMKQ